MISISSRGISTLKVTKKVNMLRAAFSLPTFDGSDEHLLFGKATVFSVCYQRRTTHERIRAFNTQVRTCYTIPNNE